MLLERPSPTRTRGRRGLAIALLVVALSGCATRPNRPVTTYAPYGPTEATQERSAAATVLSVIATPLYLALKAAVCATTVVIAAPAVAVYAVTDPEGRGWQRQELNEGFAANCGPPYVLF